jgi:hypothetical protein
MKVSKKELFIIWFLVVFASLLYGVLDHISLILSVLNLFFTFAVSPYLLEYFREREKIAKEKKIARLEKQLNDLRTTVE